MPAPPALKSAVDRLQLEGGELGGLKLAVRGGGTGAGPARSGLTVNMLRLVSFVHCRPGLEAQIRFTPGMPWPLMAGAMRARRVE